MKQLPTVIGHEDVRAALGGAVLRNELPGSLLLHGPAGIGKQRLGLWLAQRLVCQQPDGMEPCHTCKDCRLILKLEHPDLHWFFPLPRPRASGGLEKLLEALEEARAAELAVRRETPWRPTPATELVGIYLAQVMAMRRLAASRPSMGLRKVFLIGDAENLVSQEASPEAANALLKLLEEPPPDTVIIATTSAPEELLPTIRSRLLPVRIRPLAEDVVANVLVDVMGAAPSEARTAARLAQGSIGRALAFLPVDQEPGALEQIRQKARALLEDALAPTAAGRYGAALATAPTGARGDFVDTLDALAMWIRDLAAVADGAPEMVVNCDALDRLRGLADRLPARGRGVPEALRTLDLARGMTRSNINPQLTLTWVLGEVGAALVRPN